MPVLKPSESAKKQFGPRSLQRMCLAVAMRNIGAITDIGELSFDTAKPLLLKMENAAQLHEVELNCPQLSAAQMGEIWRRLLGKKFPRWEEKKLEYGIPGGGDGDDDDDMSWFDIYTTIKEAVDRDTEMATAQLQQQLAGFDKEKQGHSTKVVNSRILLNKMPGIGVRRRVPGGSGSSFAFGGGSRTKMTTGQSVLKRARREAKEISKVSTLSTLTGKLARGQIRKAPEAMVHDYRVQHNPSVVVRPPKRRLAGDGSSSAGISSVSGSGGFSLVTVPPTAAESRLLALKTGSVLGPSPGPSPNLKATSSAHERRPHQSIKRGPLPVPRRKEEEDSASGKRRYRESNTYNDGDDVGNIDELFDDSPSPSPPKRRQLTESLLEEGNTIRSDNHGNSSHNDNHHRRPTAGIHARSSAVPTRSKPMAAAVEMMESPKRPVRSQAPALPTSPSIPARKKAPVDIFFRPKKR